jgi:hypothetical protein
MKKYRKIKRHPFLIAIVTSTLIVTIIGYMGRNSLYADYNVDLVKVPRLATVMQGVKDHNYPWDIFKNSNMVTDVADNEVPLVDTKNEGDMGLNEPSQSGSIGKSEEEATNSEVKVQENNDKPSESTVADNTKDVEQNNEEDLKNTEQSESSHNTKPIPNNESEDSKTDTDKSNSQTDITDTNQGKTDNNPAKPHEQPENGEKGESIEFETVKKGYFKDALFIGDSRTVGLMEYSGWTDPTFYANVGLNIYEIFDKDIAEVDGKKTTLDKALEKQHFGKIYIMLGINELGTGTSESFAKEYQSVIKKIRKLQPDAIIFIEAIMNVSKKKSDGDSIFNNQNIKERNNAIAQLADNKKIFYIDVNEVFNDKSGGIPENYTFDGIHLKAAYYKMWTDFLLKHGVGKL